jgi:hypothetical protein
MSTSRQASSPAFAQDAVLDLTLHTGVAGQPGNESADEIRRTASSLE